jgi:AhpD family alkylhydroperoxidase
MASLDVVTTELVGIAAAVAGHCQPCLEYHLAEARQLGVDEDQIQEAVKLAEAVSRAGDKHMRDFARKTMRLPAAARPE